MTDLDRRAETTTTTPPGLTVSEDGSALNWQGVNYVPQRAETTTATDEDAITEAARVIRPFIDAHEDSGYDLDGKEVSESAQKAADALLAAGLLATAHTRPTREQIAKTLDFHFTESDYHDGCALRCGYHGDERDMHLADAVLALWETP